MLLPCSLWVKPQTFNVTSQVFGDLLSCTQARRPHDSPHFPQPAGFIADSSPSPYPSVPKHLRNPWVLVYMWLRLYLIILAPVRLEMTPDVQTDMPRMQLEITTTQTAHRWSHSLGEKLEKRFQAWSQVEEEEPSEIKKEDRGAGSERQRGLRVWRREGHVWPAADSALTDPHRYLLPVSITHHTPANMQDPIP